MDEVNMIRTMETLGYSAAGLVKRRHAKKSRTMYDEESAMNKPNNDAKWVLGLTAVASLMVALDALVLATALTEIGRAFDASIEELEWTANAYILSFAVLLITAAAMGDRFGRRRLFAAGVGLFVVASAACALAPGIGWLIAARAVQGIGAAMIMPLALALVSAAFPPEQRGRALGIYSGVTALSTVLGPVAGGAITQGLAWQWIFWLNVPIGLLTLALTLARMRESFGPREQVDTPGLLLVTGGALGLVWGLVRANQVGWGNPEIVLSLAFGAGLALAFVAWEQRRTELAWEGRCAAPMMPMHFFHVRAFAAGSAAMFLLNGAVTGAIFFMAQFLEVALGQDAFAAGLQLLPWGVTIALAAPKAGALAEKFGDRAVVVAGLTVPAVGLAWLALNARSGLAYAAIVAPMIAAGAGFAISIPVVQKTVVSAVAPQDIGKASGALSMIRQLGGAFGVAIAVAAFTHAGGHATAEAFSHGFTAANGVAAVLSLAGALAGMWLPARFAIAPPKPPSVLIPRTSARAANT
jgi:EmrB/QacA subfamily drug resistance transporter